MKSCEAALHAVSTPHSIEIFRAGGTRPVLVQNAAANSRPYIHPILSPDGIGELTENAPAHHPWQHGLYTGLNKVNGVGFWEKGLRNDPMDGTFHPKPLLPPVVNGSKAEWAVETDWRSPDGTPLLAEEQRWNFCDRGNTYELDLEWTLKAHTALTFGRYDYGGLFIRMPYREAFGGSSISSEGLAREEADGKPARWMAISMPIEGRESAAGIAIMDHPANPGYPVPWRVDGQFGAAPSLCIAGDWQLEAGSTQLFRHRVFVYTGEIDSAQIEANWNEFRNGRNN
ncbi:PmoA family protein [Paenibacillus sepulcri]